MRNHLFLLTFLTFLLIGCAGTPQTPISLNTSALSNTENRIGIAMAKLPEPSMTYPGAGCLLCMATAATTNSAISSHVKSFSTDDLTKLKGKVADTLKEKGHDVVIIPDDIIIKDLPKSDNKVPNAAKYDYTSLGKKYNISQVVVIDINSIGAVRPYSAYIPTGDPQVTITGRTYLIDLQSNMYQWYLPLSQKQSATGTWKEPPEYPAFTNAYYTLLEKVSDSILKPLSDL